MSGRHGSAGGDDASPRLIQTGPIVVRGLARGVKDVLRPGPESRHRAPTDVAATRVPEGDSPGRGREALDAVADTAQNPRGPSAPEVGGVLGAEPVTAAQQPHRDDEERPQMPSRGSIPPQGDEAASSDGERRAAPSRRPPRKKASAAPAGEVPPDTKSDAIDQHPTASAPRVDRTAPAEDDRPAVIDDSEMIDRRPTAAAAIGGDAIDHHGPGRPLRVRDRFGREALGVAVLILLAVVCAGLITAVVVKTRNDAAAAAREAAEYRAPALASSAPAGDGPVVAVVADESALRAASGVGTSDRWPELLASVAGAEVTTFASAGAGYATAGADARTFVESAARVPATADIVLFVGGAADDQVSALSLARAATQAFSAALEKAPDATVVAVGPVFRPSGTSAADLEAIRTTLRSAARIADVRWVDPVASQWVTDVDATGDLTAAKERTIANRLGTLVDAEVD